MGKKYWVTPPSAAKVTRLGVLVAQPLKTKKTAKRQGNFKKLRILFSIKKFGVYGSAIYPEKAAFFSCR
jgi:hypothetical protein